MAEILCLDKLIDEGLRDAVELLVRHGRSLIATANRRKTRCKRSDPSGTQREAEEDGGRSLRSCSAPRSVYQCLRQLGHPARFGRCLRDVGAASGSEPAAQAYPRIRSFHTTGSVRSEWDE